VAYRGGEEIPATSGDGGGSGSTQAMAPVVSGDGEGDQTAAGNFGRRLAVELELGGVGVELYELGKLRVGG